ncbi:MAG: putative Ig domain-containing protein [Planctomycetes bacterium]|nr:putative Ig domain-containing protein [Planctomycetota bacterium]
MIRNRLFFGLVLGLLATLLSGAMFAQAYSVAPMLNQGQNPGGLNTESDSTSTNWTQIIGGPQSTNVWSSSQTIPFAFQFYGQTVTDFIVSQNGVLTFTTSATAVPGANENLPSTALPDMSIAVFWDEFTASPPTNTGDDVDMQVFGTAPNRQLWVKWFSFEMGSAPRSYVYMSVVLEETTNKIYVVDYSYYNGTGTTTVGVQQNSTNATQYGTDTLDFSQSSNLSNSNNGWYEFTPLAAGFTLSSNSTGGGLIRSLTDVVVLDMNAASVNSATDVTSMTFTKTGSVSDSDVTNVELFLDNNNDHTIDAGDSSLASGSLSSGSVTLTGTGPLFQLAANTSANLLLGIDLSASVSPADTISFELSSSSNVAIGSQTDNSTYPITGGTWTVTDPNVPVFLYYKFNEGTGTATANDAIPGSGSANPTFNGNPAWITSGQAIGTAALQAGNGSTTGLGKVSTGWAADLPSSQSWTMESWIRYSGTGSPYLCGDSSANSLRFYFSSSNGLGVLGGGFTTHYASSSLGIRDNNWHHVAFVYDSSANTTTWYIDGQLDSTVTSQTPSVSGTDFQVGGYSTTTTSYQWYGDIDEFRLWDKTRSQAEIQSTMSIELPPIDSTILSVAGVDDLVAAPATDHVMMDLNAFTFVNNNNLNQVIFTKSGSISNSDVGSVRLYRDNNNDGVVDGGDSLLGTDTLSGSSTVTFSGSPLQSMTPGSGFRLLLAADVAATANPGDTLAFSIASASDITWSGGTDLTTYPLNSALRTVQGAASSFPYQLGFESPLPYYNGAVSTASNLYPTITSVGSAPGQAAAAGTGTMLVTPGPTAGSSPNSGSGMMSMAGGTNIGACVLDLLFDLSGVTSSDTVELEFWWNDEGLDPDTTTVIVEHFIGVFISTNGGTTWELAAFQIPVNVNTGVWNQEIVDLSALMSAASLNFTNQTMIRFQMAENGTTDYLLLDDIRLDVIPNSLAASPNSAADTTATAGGSTSAWVGSFDFQAYGVSQNLNGFTVTQIGSVNNGNLSNLTMWEDTNNDGVFNTGDTQFGSAVSSLSGNTATFTGSSAYAFTAGGVETFFLAADVSAAAATFSTIQFEINASSDVNVTPGPAAGSYPVQGSAVTVVPLPMVGNYTINQTTGDFADIGTAFDLLELAGVSGPVTLTITDSATYTSTPSYSLGIDNTQPVPVVTPVAGASATNTITLQVAAGQTPVVLGNANGAVLTGQSGTSPLTGRGGLVINQSYVVVDGLEVMSGPDFGIIAQGNGTSTIGLTTTDITIRRCVVHDIPDGPGIAFMGQNSGYFTNGVIENNFVWNCFTNSGNPTSSSVLLSNTGGSITVRNTASGTGVVRHNTILHTSTFTNTGGLYAYSSSTAYALNDINNNIVICTDASVPAIYLSSLTYTPTVSDFNYWFAQTQCNQATLATFNDWQTNGLDANGSNADPKVISATGTIDLHLAADSPCLNPAGQTSTATDDIDGDSRPLGTTTDIGADEGDFPQIAVAESSTNIAQNGTRNIGTVSTATGVVVTFTIDNDGSQDLILTNSTNPVAITLNQNLASATTVQTQPSLTTIPGTQSTTFQLFVQPTGNGTFNLTVTIDNNHPVLNPFTFTVSGTGLVPNDAAVANTTTASTLSGATDGPFSISLNPGATLASVEIELTDTESDNITVVSIIPPSTTPTGITAPAIPAAGHPITLQWTGTAAASNDPTDYTWQVVFADAVNQTQKSATVTITILNLAPVHAISAALAGDGSSANPYTSVYTETMGAASSVNLATVSDPNTSQTLTLGTPVLGGSNPTGGSGFSFQLQGGFLNVAPTAALTANDVGTHTFDIDVDDGLLQTTISVSIDVAAAPAITTTSPLANGEQGLAYTPLSIVATGGTGSLTYTVSAGALPNGMTLSSAGSLSGTPTAANTYNFTVTVTDTLNVTASTAFVLTIDPPATGTPSFVTTTPLPIGVEGQSYGPVSILASGGTGSYTFTSTGSLPPGITLSAAGALTGTPTLVGVYSFDITVTDSAFASTTQNFSLEVKAPATGGGSGGGGGGGCVADGSGNSYLWGVLLGALALLVVVSRVRVARD